MDGKGARTGIHKSGVCVYGKNEQIVAARLPVIQNGRRTTSGYHAQDIKIEQIRATDDYSTRIHGNKIFPTENHLEKNDNEGNTRTADEADGQRADHNSRR